MTLKWYRLKSYVLDDPEIISSAFHLLGCFLNIVFLTLKLQINFLYYIEILNM